MCPKLTELLSWNGPTVHVCCFMLARASTKTFVSRVQKTAKKIFVNRKLRQQGHSLAEVSLYFKRTLYICVYACTGLINILFNIRFKNISVMENYTEIIKLTSVQNTLKRTKISVFFPPFPSISGQMGQCSAPF